MQSDMRRKLHNFLDASRFLHVSTLTLMIVSPISCARISPIFNDPLSCSASANMTFSWSSLACVKCQWSFANQPDSCPCPSSMRDIGEIDVFSFPSSPLLRDRCEHCPNGTIVYDGRHCLKCGDLNPYNVTSGQCQACPAGHIEVVYNWDGTPNDTVRCEKCGMGYQPSDNRRNCIPCHPSFTQRNGGGNNTSEQLKSWNGTCTCPDSKGKKSVDGVCVSMRDTTIDPKSSFKIYYDHHEIESGIFKEHIRLAQLLCKEDRHNQTACQILANLCTLNLHSYDTDSGSTACGMYTKISGRLNHQLDYLPKLYYNEHEAQVLLQNPNEIPQQYNIDFSSYSSDINITTAKFSFEGKFLGLSDLSEHIPCSDTPEAQSASRKFGTSYSTKCSMGVQQLWHKYEESQMVFLDPFLSFQGGYNNDIRLYNLPVRITNFRKNGIRSNLNDQMQWQLVRRFFMVDSIGGYEDDKTGTPTSVRYLSEMNIKIQLQNSPDPGRIYVPLMTLTYKDMTKDEFLRNEQIDFHFSINYNMDMSRSLEDVKISVGVISAFAVIWAAIQTWSWNRRNGRMEIDIETIANLFIISCGHLANAFFIVCFGSSLFWLIFFKKQSVVHVLLPDPLQEKLVRDLLISAFSLKIVENLELLRRQASIDIFFIDWERPRARSAIHLPNERHNNDRSVADSHKSEDSKSESVSIWRSYFVANEWNEIQTTRKVNIPFQAS